MSYKVVLCPHCRRMFITQAEKHVRCPYCGKSYRMSRLVKDGFVLRRTYTWEEAHEFINRRSLRGSG